MIVKKVELLMDDQDPAQEDQHEQYLESPVSKEGKTPHAGRYLKYCAYD